MGFFDSLLSPFEYIGSGISKAATTVKHSVLDPIYNKVLKPVYNKVVVPVYNRVGKPIVGTIGRVADKTLNTGEHLATNTLDFTEKASKGNQNLFLDAQKGADGLLKFFSNPIMAVGAGIVVLAVVSKI
jgi:hypothetical protein